MLRPNQIFILGISVLVCASCDREEPVRVYEVIVPPSAQTAAPESAPDQPKSAAMSAATATSDSVKVRYNIPETWVAQPLPQMVNRGNYLLPDLGNGRPALTISSFPGTVGGLPANLNRWRRQMGLAELPEQEVVAGTDKRTVDGFAMNVCFYEGTGKDGTPHTMAGAILSLSDESWFFKMTGPTKAMEAAKAEFLALLDTVKVLEAASNKNAPSSGSPPPPSASSGSPPPSSASSGSMPPTAGANAPQTPSVPKPEYVVPSGWREMDAGSMRSASFIIAGPDSLNADVSVVRLAGDAGGAMQNVNLWRQQLGLPPLAGDMPAGTMESLTTGANTWQVFDAHSLEKILQGEYKGRIMAAMMKSGDNTWVVRLRGEQNHLEQEKENFRAFLSSLKFP